MTQRLASHLNWSCNLLPFLKGKAGEEKQSKLIEVSGSSAPSYAQVKFRFGLFQWG